HPVLNEGGQPIVFEPEDDKITIGEAGDMVINGEQRDRLGVMEFANPQMLERVGQTMFKSDVPGQPPLESRVLHGVLEGSNVKPVAELTHMISVSRGVGSTAKLIDAQYELGRKASNAWA